MEISTLALLYTVLTLQANAIKSVIARNFLFLAVRRIRLGESFTAASQANPIQEADFPV